MSLPALDRLATAQARLVTALSHGDIAEIEDASRALAREVDQVRNIAVWHATPELKARATGAVRLAEGARLRLGYLADHGRRRLQMLLGLSGRSAAGYGRDGRIRLPRG
ncbi:MAG: hypothetical protein JWL91_1983 [Sphingomonas bacterium]|jgi:hypothetical protein|nr:hypothetical protein [Sphingomonas bacterium]MDB5690107.1 hypothetical protein [Sphingomonas bacterium]